MPPVAFTGVGMLTPFGEGLEPLWEALFGNRTALRERPGFPGGVSGIVPGREDWRRPGRVRRLALDAGRQALREAQLPGGHLARTGLCLGTIVGEAGHGLRCQHPGLSPARRAGLRAAWSWGTLARRVARRLELGGVVIPVSTACASGADALGLAAAEIAAGRAPAMLAGGAEAVTPFQWEGFRRLGALDPEGVHPFDARRAGTGLGEGACLCVLEEESQARQRGAPILGRVLGWGTSADAMSLAAPDPAGRGLVRAARAALGQAGCSPEEVSFVVAHGTGTPTNDRSEALALREVFGARLPELPVTALKGATGHCFGASAAIEAAVALACLRHGSIPPVVGLRDLDPGLVVQPTRGGPRRVSPGVALALASGLGGQNTALVLGGAR